MLDIVFIIYISKMERLEGYGIVLVDKILIKKGDVVIVYLVFGRNLVSIEFVMKVKENKVIVICIINLSYLKSVFLRYFLGKKFYEVCDLVIDNYG